MLHSKHTHSEAIKTKAHLSEFRSSSISESWTWLWLWWCVVGRMGLVEFACPSGSFLRWSLGRDFDCALYAGPDMMAILSAASAHLNPPALSPRNCIDRRFEPSRTNRVNAEEALSSSSLTFARRDQSGERYPFPSLPLWLPSCIKWRIFVCQTSVSVTFCILMH